jgi:hypothetical protein
MAHIGKVEAMEVLLTQFFDNLLSHHTQLHVHHFPPQFVQPKKPQNFVDVG